MNDHPLDSVTGASGEAPSRRPALTKIIATVGPASHDAETIARLIEAGVSIFRINYSHGDLSTHSSVIRVIREQAESAGLPIAILGDLPGPKIRVGEVVEGGVEVPEGAEVIFQQQPIEATCNGPPFRFSSLYSGLVEDVRAGDRVLINDGAVRLLALEHRDGDLICTVTAGGVITRRKGINLPDTELSVQALTERDWECVGHAIDNSLDFLALSFVRSPDDINALRIGVTERLEAGNHPEIRLPIIAKIEVPRAVQHIESIVEAADAVMIARGDLGVEMDLARVPIIQKQIARVARDHGKPCIVATQMLESMIHSATPTRAEASDVAGAIFEQADAVMLSGETAVGQFPVLTVETMRRIAEQTEAHLALQPPRGSAPVRLVESRYRTAALAHGVWTTAQDWGARFIVVWSQHGGGARYLSQNNFNIPILAVSSDERALRQMQLARGVTPIAMPVPESLSSWTRQVDTYLQAADWAIAGHRCLLVAGAPLGVSGVTNRLAIHTIGDPGTGFAE